MESGSKSSVNSNPAEQPGSQGGQFYDSAWEQWNDMIRYSPAPRFRREKLLKWLKQRDVKSLLDVGCGNGEFIHEFRKILPEARAAGADISPQVIADNQKRMREVDFYTLDLNEAQLDQKFDAVVSMEVVEHCEDYRDAIKKLAAMTENWLMITVPCGPIFEIDRRVGHTRHFKAADIAEAITAAGLKVEIIQRWGFPFFNLYKRAINISPDLMSERFLSARKYTLKEKLISQLTYLAFKLSLPWGGFQLFVVARR